MASAPDPDRSAQARAYARERFRLSLLSMLLAPLVLLALLLSGASAEFRAWLAGHCANVWGIVAADVAGLMLFLSALEWPLALLGRRIEIRYGLNRQTLRGWWADQGKGVGLELLLGLPAAEAIYWLLRNAPTHWWLIGWAGFVLLAVILAQLAPVLLLPLFYRFRRLDPGDPREAELAARIESLCARARTRIRGVYRWELGEKSAKANAALAGWGASRRVLLSDTLMDQAPPEQVEAVCAHELGHQRHHHIWQGLAFQSALSWIGFAVAARLLVHFSYSFGLLGIADIAGLPLLLLVGALVSLLLLPLSNAFSRRMERQADDDGFALMGSAQPLLAALARLADQNLSELRPPRWKEALFYSHPAPATRLERGRRWQESHSTR